MAHGERGVGARAGLRVRGDEEELRVAEGEGPDGGEIGFRVFGDLLRD